MKIYAENKKGYFNYEILNDFEAGVVLTGAEVKSIRDKRISLKESFATMKQGEIWLTNTHVSPYKPARNPDYDPIREKKLLLAKSEINKIIGSLSGNPYTLIPLRIYDKNGKIKVLIGLARGRKKHDKRDKIKKRDIEKDVKKDLREKLR